MTAEPRRWAKIVLTRRRVIVVMSLSYLASLWAANRLFSYVQRSSGYDDTRDEQVTLAFASVMTVLWLVSLFRTLLGRTRKRGRAMTEGVIDEAPVVPLIPTWTINALHRKPSDVELSELEEVERSPAVIEVMTQTRGVQRDLIGTVGFWIGIGVGLMISTIITLVFIPRPVPLTFILTMSITIGTALSCKTFGFRQTFWTKEQRSLVLALEQYKSETRTLAEKATGLRLERLPQAEIERRVREEQLRLDGRLSAQLEDLAGRAQGRTVLTGTLQSVGDSVDVLEGDQEQ